MRIVSRFIFANRKFYLGASLFLLILFGGSMATVSATGDCGGDNDIIHCGFSSNSDFISTVKSNNSGNGHSDLKPIYDYYGLASADYSRFVTSAKSGTAYKDGRIIVDGQVVATNAKSVGRLASYQGAGYFSKNIPGAGTLYGNTNDRAFASNSLPVTVLFNSKGEVEFAVIDSCGNPIYGNNVSPSYSCNLLHQAPVSGSARTFKFTTDARAGNNASITKLVYTFGDGSTKTVTGASSPSVAVTHTYAKDGNYTARVTVYVSLPGKQTITVTSANCATLVVVATPFYQCLQLAAVPIGSSRYQYKFTVTGKAGNGASLTTADFSFGDGATIKGVPVSGVTATTTHPYGKYGNQKASATFHVKLPDGRTATVTSSGCAKTVPVAVPYYNCVQLGGAILDASKFSYSFTVSANYGNGASFKRADFDFGDKQSTKNVSPSGTSATTTHTYANAGNYTATATLYFTINGNTKDVKSVKCTALVTPNQPPTPECKPGVPEGSALCSPCQYNSSIPASDTEHCVAPVTSLPNTGAGDVIAIFGAAVVGGFLIFRQFIYKKHAMGGDAGTMTAEGSFVGPVVSEATGVVVSHHLKPKHARRHPNAVHPLHHPTYHHPHRFRPTDKQE